VVYVTHDQVEAMTLADRIVVLNKGKVQQQGSPLELYNRPANMFVAAFIGNPSMNFFEGQLSFEGNERKVFRFREAVIDFSNAPTPAQPGNYVLGLRPESLKVLAREGREAQGSNDLQPVVVLNEPHGHETHLVAKVHGHQVIIRSANPKRLQVMESAKQGDSLSTTIDRTALHWFEANGEGLRVTQLNG
jgi:multiple sugar transport system ATP-binding protein